MYTIYNNNSSGNIRRSCYAYIITYDGQMVQCFVYGDTIQLPNLTYNADKNNLFKFKYFKFFLSFFQCTICIVWSCSYIPPLARQVL